MNINKYTSKPTMFKNIKSSFALCDETGLIIQIYTQLASAKYMLTSYQFGAKIYEVVQDKNSIISVLGEV